MAAIPPPELSESDIKSATEAYWDLPRMQGFDGDVCDLYVNGRPGSFPHGLLGPELVLIAKALAQRKRCDILVLMVGYSFEPLLQSICHHNPTTKIVLAANSRYDGDDTWVSYGRKVKGYIQTLRKNVWIRENWFTNDPDVLLIELADESATGIFRALHDCLATLTAPAARAPDAAPRVVIDITGGKKNMDAGAYLYAAYTDVPVSYVNFSVYHTQERRPYGYSCHVTELANPYTTFNLRNWEALRGHYCANRFEQARETLASFRQKLAAAFRPADDQILPASATTDAQVGESLALLEKLLDFYVAWDAGAYAEAQARAQALKLAIPTFKAPTAVEKLSDIWKTIRGHTEKLTRESGRYDRKDDLKADLARAYGDVFWNNERLFAYIEDELARTSRLACSGNCRAALLRAAGVDEFLLKTRIVRLWREHQLEPGRRGRYECGALERDIDRREWFEALLTHSSAHAMRRMLSRSDGFLPVRIGDDSGYCLKPKTALTPIDFKIKPTATGARITGEMLTALRNQASHFYLYVDADLAQAAIAVAEANWNEMREPRWANPEQYGALPDRQEARVAAIPWSDVVAGCKLSFLPHLSESSPTSKEGAHDPLPVERGS
jgi:hypothetical protein